MPNVKPPKLSKSELRTISDEIRLAAKALGLTVPEYLEQRWIEQNTLPDGSPHPLLVLANNTGLDSYLRS